MRRIVGENGIVASKNRLSCQIEMKINETWYTGILRTVSDILAGEFREGHSPTTQFACLGAPFLRVFSLSSSQNKSQKWWG